MHHTSETSDQNKQVADYWQWVADREEKGFWNLPGWDEHQNILASGSPDRNWLQVLAADIRAHFGGKPTHALSLGCGSGYLEPLLLSHGVCTSCDACDISPGLVEVGQANAVSRQLPIRYFVADLNHPSFAKEEYDVVVAAASIHHVENLEGLFANIAQTLKPGGLLLLYDYVGPSRFQWSLEQMGACNRWVRQLPMAARVKRGYPWHYIAARAVFCLLPFRNSARLDAWVRRTCSTKIYYQFLRLKAARLVLNEVKSVPPEQFLVTDPSEAVRSADILPVLRQHFSITRSLPQGGTIVAPLFGRIVENFINNKAMHAFVRSVLEDERNQVLSGSLPSDFVALIAEPLASSGT